MSYISLESDLILIVRYRKGAPMNRTCKLLIAILLSLAVLFIHIPFLKADVSAAEETTVAEATVASDIEPAYMSEYPDTRTTIGLLTLLLGATLLFLAKCMIETRNIKEASEKNSK